MATISLALLIVIIASVFCSLMELLQYFFDCAGYRQSKMRCVL